MNHNFCCHPLFERFSCMQICNQLTNQFKGKDWAGFKVYYLAASFIIVLLCFVSWFSPPPPPGPVPSLKLWVTQKWIHTKDHCLSFVLVFEYVLALNFHYRSRAPVWVARTKSMLNYIAQPYLARHWGRKAGPLFGDFLPVFSIVCFWGNHTALIDS